MKFFFIAFLVIAGICGYFWATDGPHSGMWMPTVGAVVIAGAIGAYNWVRNGSPFDDNSQGR